MTSSRTPSSMTCVEKTAEETAMTRSSADERAPKPPGRSPGGDSQVVAQVQAAARGDQRAWNALVERYAGLVWSVARGYRLSDADAADVSQATWLRLVENLDRVRDPAAIAGWLATTTRRECLRVVRRASRETMLDGDAWSLVDADEAPVDEALLGVERRREVREAFDRLPERRRQLLLLLVADPPMSYAEISAALQIPIGSIGPTRRRCLEQLRCLLDPATVGPGC